MAEQHRVRLTIRPDEEVVVGDAELLDLQRAGLVLREGRAKAPAPKPSTAPAADSKKEN